MQQTISFLSALAFLFLLAACGNTAKDEKGSLADKKARLEELRQQKDQLNTQIDSLQASIDREDPEAAKEANSKLVAITPVKSGDFSHFIDLQGKVEADDIAYVTPRGQGGQVLAIYVKQGQNVKKGQLLMKLENDLAQKQVDQLESQLAYVKDLYQRQQNLWKQNIGTEVQLITAKNNVEQVEKQLALAKEQLSYGNVYAQMSGVADEVTIRVGEIFSPASAAMSGIRIVNTSDLKITTEVPENYLGKVNVGSTVEVTLPEANKSFTTKVKVAGKVIDPSSRTFYIEAAVPSGQSARPNQIALVRIRDYNKSNTVTIPVNTLQTDENGKYVMVAVKQGDVMVAQKRKVIIGELYENDLEIKSGLEPGDQLITEGFQGLYEGQVLTTSVK